MFTGLVGVLMKESDVTERQGHMNLLSAATTKSFTTTHALKMATSQMLMTCSTFEFHVDTLIEELKDHPHREEIISLCHEQLLDDDTIVY